MSLLWPYFWPLLAIGFVIGALTGRLAFRRRRRFALAAGAAAALAAAAVWHAPAGASERFVSSVERIARTSLDYYEMTRVRATLERRPLTRVLILDGPADDWQRGELERVFSQVPGVSRARFGDGGWALPMFVEAALASFAAFLFGLLLAYLVELRRRYNAQWTW